MGTVFRIRQTEGGPTYGPMASEERCCDPECGQPLCDGSDACAMPGCDNRRCNPDENRCCMWLKVCSACGGLICPEHEEAQVACQSPSCVGRSLFCSDECRGGTEGGSGCIHCTCTCDECGKVVLEVSSAKCAGNSLDDCCTILCQDCIHVCSECQRGMCEGHLAEVTVEMTGPPGDVKPIRTVTCQDCCISTE